jgi:hypothetical protein
LLNCSSFAFLLVNKGFATVFFVADKTGIYREAGFTSVNCIGKCEMAGVM